MNTDSNVFEFNKNAFDIVRYWAAISIMLLHFSHYGMIISDNCKGLIIIISKVVSFFPGVVVLFSISGFLVCASLERSKNGISFLLKRAKRIYPELWLSALVNFIIIYIVAKDMLDKSIIVWLFTQVTGIANTPECLSEFGTGSINGALWTVFTEIQLYIVLAVSYKYIKRLTAKPWVLLLLLFAALNVAFEVGYNPTSIISKLIERSFLPYALWFLIGTFCYINKQYIVPILRKFLIPILIVYSICRIAPFHIPGYYDNVLCGILAPFIVIGLAYILPAVRLKYDITYSLFLYHWIIINLIVHFKLFENQSFIVCLAIYLVATATLAVISNAIIKKILHTFANKALIDNV